MVLNRLIIIFLVLYHPVLWAEDHLKPQSQNETMDCHQQMSNIGAEGSSEISYFKNLLQKGETADLNEFLHLWYPHGRNSQNLVADLKDDVDPMVQCFDESGSLTDEAIHSLEEGSEKDSACFPSALYSWGGDEKLKALSLGMPDGNNWQGRANPKSRWGVIFTSISAISTFAYGDTVIRFKIKKGTPFVLSEFGAGEGKVSVRDDTVYHDYTFDSSDIVESWSYNTPEIYDELVRDILRISSGNTSQIYNGSLAGSKLVGIDRLIRTSNNLDGHKVSIQSLKSTLLKLINAILMNEGRIHYNEGSCRNRDLHYSTTTPNYITPMRAIGEDQEE